MEPICGTKEKPLELSGSISWQHIDFKNAIIFIFVDLNLRKGSENHLYIAKLFQIHH